MRVTRIGLVATLLSVIPLGVVQAQAPDESEEVNRVTTLQVNPTVYQLKYALHHPKVPKYARSVAFWEAVAWCETHHEWDRGKDWGPNARAWVSGGLGIANSTWRGYGGREFAKKAALATKEEQIIVATRVAFVGYQTKKVYMTFEDRVNDRPFYRPPAGFGRLAGKVKGQGWGGRCREDFISGWKNKVKSKP